MLSTADCDLLAITGRLSYAVYHVIAMMVFNTQTKRIENLWKTLRSEIETKYFW